MAMKILFIDFNLPYLLRDALYPIGGWAIELDAWIKGLRANGHQIGVLTWKGANHFAGKKLNFDLIETYDPAKGVRIIKYFYYYIPALYKKTAGYEPDVIIQACAEHYTGIMAVIAKTLKVPFLYRVANDMDTDQRYKEGMPKYAQIAYQYGLKNADAVLCQNQYQHDAIRKNFPQKPVWILHNPFPKTVDVLPALFSERQYIAWLGVFKKQKNLPRLYETARQMPELHFKVAGMPGKRMDRHTENALMGLERLSNVKLTGYLSRDEVYPFLSKALALLNTSHYEGFSNVFLEAFAMGTPVIAPAHADPDHIIQKNGLGLATSEDTDLPTQINRFLRTGVSLFDETSQRCRDYVKKNHDPEILAQRLVEIIRQVKNGSVGRR